MTHRARDFLVRQQTQLSNALRADLAEYGVVAPKGVHNVGRLLALADKATLPEAARLSIRSLAAVWPQSGRSLADQFRNTHTRIEEITAMVKAEAQGNPVAKRLQI